MTDQNNQLTADAAQELRIKPWYKKWWVLFILILGAYFFTMLAVVLLSSPDNNDIKIGANLAASQNENVDEILLFKDTDNNPSFGRPDSKVRIVEFSDFQCQYSREVFSTVREILSRYRDDVYFVFRDFPVAELHAQAVSAALAGRCANEQDKFWPMHDKLFLNQDKLLPEDINMYAQEIGLDTKKFNNCLAQNKFNSQIEQDFAAGVSFGVQGTPTFFINGVKVSGAIPRQTFFDIIDGLLK